MSDNSNMYLGLHVKCPVFLYYFNETWIFWTDGSIQFYAYLLCGSRINMCGHTDKCDEAGRRVVLLCKHTDKELYVQRLCISVKLPFCDLV
jgi:Cu2+-containing amine oxidase